MDSDGVVREPGYRPGRTGLNGAEFHFDVDRVDMEEERPPMWGWRKILAVSVLAVLLLVSAFLGGYFHGLHSARGNRDAAANISQELFDSGWQRLPCIGEDETCPEGAGSARHRWCSSPWMAFGPTTWTGAATLLWSG